LDTGNKQKRNRLIALSFASVLLLLIYGPLAQWFIAADRIIYDLMAAHLPSPSLDKAVIVSIDASRTDAEDVLEQYGLVLERLHQAEVKRIIMANPPDIAAEDPVPAWAMSLGSGIPVFVPTRHRLADLASHNGFVEVRADSDDVLRRSELWQLNEGVKTPSLPLAIAFANQEAQATHYISSAEDAIYHSNYRKLRRLDVNDLIDGRINSRGLVGYTVFLDSDIELVDAEARLPSGNTV